MRELLWTGVRNIRARRVRTLIHFRRHAEVIPECLENLSRAGIAQFVGHFGDPGAHHRVKMCKGTEEGMAHVYERLALRGFNQRMKRSVAAQVRK
jgi:L-rhamnose mutarotase